MKRPKYKELYLKEVANSDRHERRAYELEIMADKYFNALSDYGASEIECIKSMPVSGKIKVKKHAWIALSCHFNSMTRFSGHAKKHELPDLLTIRGHPVVIG